jgi:hypothetical protein
MITIIYKIHIWIIRGFQIVCYLSLSCEKQLWTRSANDLTSHRSEASEPKNEMASCITRFKQIWSHQNCNNMFLEWIFLFIVLYKEIRFLELTYPPFVTETPLMTNSDDRYFPWREVCKSLTMSFSAQNQKVELSSTILNYCYEFSSWYDIGFLELGGETNLQNPRAKRLDLSLAFHF